MKEGCGVLFKSGSGIIICGEKRTDENQFFCKRCLKEMKALSNQSPPIRTSDKKSDSANAEELNISLKETSSEVSQISSNDETSLNNNIMFNLNEELQDVRNQQNL